MIGKTLAHYRIVEKLGEGGMGEVYRASDTKLGRDVALKVLPPAFARDAARMARFQREAKTLAALNHPNIAAIYGLEDSGGAPHLVLELVEGEALDAVLRRGPMPLDEALATATQIAAAVEAAHERGIVHRDLKPANVMITRRARSAPGAVARPSPVRRAGGEGEGRGRASLRPNLRGRSAP